MKEEFDLTWLHVCFSTRFEGTYIWWWCYTVMTATGNCQSKKSSLFWRS